MKKLLLLCCIAINFQTNSMPKATATAFLTNSPTLSKAIKFLQKSGYEQSPDSKENEIILTKGVLDDKKISISCQTFFHGKGIFNISYEQKLSKMKGTGVQPDGSSDDLAILIPTYSKTQTWHFLSAANLIKRLKKITKKHSF